jgi:hypothetical protein
MELMQIDLVPFLQRNIYVSYKFFLLPSHRTGTHLVLLYGLGSIPSQPVCCVLAVLLFSLLHVTWDNSR